MACRMTDNSNINSAIELLSEHGLDGLSDVSTLSRTKSYSQFPAIS